MAKVLLLLSTIAFVQVAVSRTAQTATTEKPVALQLFYETLCGDSKRFVMNQLEPTFRLIGSGHIEVDFVPYGHANTTESCCHLPQVTSASANTGYTFVCQHGPQECEGNKRQACALKRISDNSKQVKFVYCIMAQKDPSAPNDKCVTEAGLDLNEVAECTNGTEGDTLLASMGDKTPEEFDFLKGYIPSIHISGEWNTAAEFDLFNVICDKLGDNGPAVCGRCPSSASSASVAQAMILSVLLSVFFI